MGFDKKYRWRGCVELPYIYIGNMGNGLGSRIGGIKRRDQKISGEAI